MPVLCQEPFHKPEVDHSLYPPRSELISMASCQGGPPSLPCPSWGRGEGPKGQVRGPVSGTCSSWVFSSPPRARPAQPPERAQGPQRGNPCSPSSTPPICCHLRRHMLRLHTQKTPHAHFGGQWLPAAQAGGGSRTRGTWGLALHRPTFHGGLGQAPPAPSLRRPGDDVPLSSACPRPFLIPHSVAWAPWAGCRRQKQINCLFSCDVCNFLSNGSGRK